MKVELKNVKIAGVLGALIPVFIALISEEGLRALIAAVTQQTMDAAQQGGLDSIALTIIAGILGAVGSGIIAYYKQLKANAGDNGPLNGENSPLEPIAGTRSVFVPPTPPKSPTESFLMGS